MAEWLRRVSVWGQDGTSQVVTPGALAEAETDGFRWFELTCGGEETGTVLEAIGRYCPGLTEPMLQDLLTPDDRPEGARYAGDIRLASSFSVAPWRPNGQSERGKPQGVGVLRFQPVELLAGDSWLVTCWHPERIFQGSTRVDEQPPGDADDLFEAVAKRWKRNPGQLPGDLGISVMHGWPLPTHPPIAPSMPGSRTGS